MNQHAEMTEAADAAARTVAQVEAGQLGLPTPCTDWDVRTLLNHLIVWTSFSLEARAQGGSVSEELTERDVADEPGFAAVYRAQLDRALAAWSDPAVWAGSLDVMGSATPAADVAALNLAEMVLHGWDLAAATGQRFQVSDAAAAAALQAVEANAELFRQYKGFAEPVRLPAGASVLDQVLAASGRDPGWTPGSTG
jgi:uncharacterized protein (TIGR03086 family)